MRNTFLNELHEVLSKGSFFELTDFEIERSVDKGGDTRLTIKYAPNPEFRVYSQIPLSRDTKDYGNDFIISANVFPGEININEFVKFKGKAKFFQGLEEWKARVYEELLTIPLIRQSENQKQQIEEILEELDDLDNTFFTRGEAEALKERLDELEARFVDSIKLHAEDEDRQGERLKTLHEEIEDLKSKTESRTKKGWARSFAHKFVTWSSDPDNQKLLGTGAKAIKLLLEAGKSIGL